MAGQRAAWQGCLQLQALLLLLLLTISVDKAPWQFSLVRGAQVLNDVACAGYTQVLLLMIAKACRQVIDMDGKRVSRAASLIPSLLLECSPG